MTPRRKEAGFTLIEVLAALLIFSLAIMGLTRTGTQSAQAVAALEQKTWAGVVADNQLVLTRSAPPVTGRRTGTADVMGRKFAYAVETADTDTPRFYKITIDVRADAGGRANETGQIIVQRTGFMALNAPQASVVTDTDAQPDGEGGDQ